MNPTILLFPFSEVPRDLVEQYCQIAERLRLSARIGQDRRKPIASYPLFEIPRCNPAMRADLMFRFESICRGVHCRARSCPSSVSFDAGPEGSRFCGASRLTKASQASIGLWHNTLPSRISCLIPWYRCDTEIAGLVSEWCNNIPRRVRPTVSPSKHVGKRLHVLVSPPPAPGPACWVRRPWNKGHALAAPIG